MREAKSTVMPLSSGEQSTSGLVRRAGRAAFRVFPGLRTAYHALRQHATIVKRALFHLGDAAHTYRHMRWDADGENYWKLSAEVIFYAHKLEKGLCIPGRKRFFGADPVAALLGLLGRWRRGGYSLEDPVYLGALECLRAYRVRITITPPPPEHAASIAERIDQFLKGTSATPELATPAPVVKAELSSDMLRQLCIARRSVRAYRNGPVPLDDIRRAVAVAQLSPSACNRQPWRVHVYDGRQKIDAMLALQNGNRGFGHLVPTLLVLTADANGFFDGSERHQPYIDAGLFTMSLLLALQSQGLATCCLNWCVTTPDLDREAHMRGDIPLSEKIVMFMAVGYADDEALAPRSARRHLDSFLKLH